MESQKTLSQIDSIFLALAVAIMVIGTATGSAAAMLIMSAITLLLMAISYGQKLSARLLVPTVTAAIAAVAIGAIMAIQ